MPSPSRQQQKPRPPRRVVPPGLVVVDKPSGMTSHDVVAKVRRFLGTKKVGHAGTLDPMATGVLVLGIERATKILGHLALDSKAYLATIRLGAATTTDDAEGEVLSSADAAALSEAAIRAVIDTLTGDIQQVPSSVSAVKIGGKRAYALARAGEQVEIPPRPVTVARFDLLHLSRTETFTDLDVLVECSSGTYVRALARDLGAALDVGGHLTALRRTRVGPFGIARSRTLDALEAEPGLSMDLGAAVAAAFPRRDVDASEAAAVAHGQALPAAGIDGTYGVFGPDGVIALMREDTEAARAVVVLAPAG